MFNKAIDFNRGCLSNMHYENGVLKEIIKDKSCKSFMISRVLDSCETDMEWHQLILYMENVHVKDVFYTITVYASNTLEFQVEEGIKENIEEILVNKKILLEEKKRVLKPYCQKISKNINDILLHEVKGRYLWFVLESNLNQEQFINIEKIKVCFPRKSWISYLPEVYQSEDKGMFLERFLAIFQTLYEEVNQEIMEMPYFIDLDGTNMKFLQWMAKWLDIAQSYMWSEEQLRSLLQNAVKLYKIRGTRKSVSELVKIYCRGESPYIVENFQVRNGKDKNNKSAMENLYGDNAYRFYVIVKEEYVPSVHEYQTLIKIIEEVKPAYMELELIVLKPFIFLGRHSYLGINSVLGEYRNMILDGTSMLEFSILGEEDNNWLL